LAVDKNRGDEQVEACSMQTGAEESVQIFPGKTFIGKFYRGQLSINFKIT
jgi:hypothetical protein